MQPYTTTDMPKLNVHVYALLIILQQKFGEIINDTSLPSVAAFRHFGREEHKALLLCAVEISNRQLQPQQ